MDFTQQFRYLLASLKASKILLFTGFFSARVYDLSRTAYYNILNGFHRDNYSKSESVFKLNSEMGASTREILDSVWKSYPRKWPIARYWEIFTTIYMVFMLMKVVLPIDLLLTLLFGDRARKPFHCYIIGKPVVAMSIHKFIQFMIVSFHLIYRYIQKQTRPHISNLAMFILQDKRAVDLFHSKFDEQQVLFSNDEQMNSHRQREQNHNLSVEEKFLRHILCYRINLRSRVSYRVRPNRSPKFLSYFSRCLTKFNLYLLLATSPIGITITHMGLSSVFLDSNYIYRYPGCEPDLERANAEGRLTPWSITFTTRRVITIILDSVENTSIWLESGLALSAIFPFVVLINQDCLIYWRHIHEKMESLSRKLKLEWFVADSDPNQADLRNHTIPADEQRQQPESLHASSRLWRNLERKNQLERWRSLELEAQELRALIYDFFSLKKSAELIISDGLSSTIAIWTTQLIVLDYHSVIKKPGEPLQYQVNVFPIHSFAMFTILGIYLLKLNQKILESYPLLCSIMAYDRSRFKRKFIEITNFYVARKRYANTLFRQYPFVSVTYLTIIGWTLSGGIILQNLFKNYLRL